MTTDKILKECGDFGPAQWCLLALFSFVNVFSAFHYFSQTFISLTPDRSKTFNYDFNSTFEGNNTVIYGKVADGQNNGGWKFETLTDELNWVGDDGWKSALVQSMFFLGSVTGTLVLGLLSDLFGRIPMLFSSNILAVIGNLLTVYLPQNIWCLGFARFVAGLATDTNFFMMYIIVMEYIKPSMRTSGLNICIGVWYCLGCVSVPWLAVATKNWRTFLLSISGPILIIPISSFFVPESAQWLHSVGRTEEALSCYKQIAAINGTKISAKSIENFQPSKNKKGSLMGLFKTPKLRQRTFILIFKTIVLSLCYDGISRNIEGLGIDSFSVFSITSVSIFPSCLIIVCLQDKLGRKVISFTSLLLAGIFNFIQCISIVSFKNLAYLNAILGVVERLFVNIAYNSGTQYAAELIPTQVRGRGLALIHSVGYGATFLSPYILYLATVWIGIPQMILGSLSVAGAVLCLLLPETLNKALPSTLEDGENFEEEKIWNFFKLK